MISKPGVQGFNEGMRHPKATQDPEAMAVIGMAFHDLNGEQAWV